MTGAKHEPHVDAHQGVRGDRDPARPAVAPDAASHPAHVAPDAASHPAHRPGFVYFVSYGIMAPLLRVIFRPTIVGAENIPRTGRVILASNHLSFIDSFVIPLVTPRRVQYLAKSSYFTGTGVKGYLTRTWFTSIGAVGIERGAGKAAQDALDAGRDILESESAFAIYPEGTRSLDGRLYKGRTGVAWLALTTGAVVVPVGLIGTEEIQPVGSNFPRVRKITVAFGAPIDVSRHGPATSGRARRQATDEIMTAIRGLSGQKPAGRYNEVPPTGTLHKLADRVFPRERV